MLLKEIIKKNLSNGPTCLNHLSGTLSRALKAFYGCLWLLNAAWSTAWSCSSLLCLCLPHALFW